MGSVEKLGLTQDIIPSKNHHLVNASGHSMDIVGTINIEVKFNGMIPLTHEFKVLNTKTYANILLGRDLMKIFGTVKFDFDNNRVQLANVWQQGLNVRTKEQVPIKEKTIIPARTERTVLVKCNKRVAMLSADFEPHSIPGTSGLFTSRARVIPNMDGIFQLTFLNVTESDKI